MTHICLVFGGNGSEKDVSFASSRSILKALTTLEFQVSELNFDENFISNISKIKPDVIFNAMHGGAGEDGTLPTILNFLKIPYTHSGRIASAVCMNKELTKQIAASLGLPVIKSFFCTKAQLLSGDFESFTKSFIKPCSEGSTVGCVIFEPAIGFSEKDVKTITNVEDNFFLVEEFYEGIEISIGVLGENTIGGVQIMPKSGYYDYTSKYTKGMTDYILPPHISSNLLQKLENATLKIHQTIGLKSVSRADFLVKDNDFRFLEINTHPGFTETSLIPKMALNKGFTFEEVIKFLVNDASFEPYNK